MPAATYNKKPTIYTAAQNTDLNDLSGISELGATLYNGPDNVPVIPIGDEYVSIPVGSWLVRVDDLDTTWAVVTDEVFQAYFTATEPPSP